MVRLTLALLVIVVLLAALGSAQEHARTIDECRADLALWEANGEQIPKLSFQELMARQHLLADCAQVDRESDHFYHYTLLHARYEGEQKGRLMNFLARHGLGQQFLTEDAAGDR
jgi:hypothetical protein